VILLLISSSFAQGASEKKDAALLVTRTLMEKGFEEAVNVLTKISSDRENYKFEEKHLLRIAITLMYDQKKVHESITLIKLIKNILPESSQIYAMLGEAYILDSDRENAKLSYEKALKLNPQNEVSQKMLQDLDKKISELSYKTPLEMKYSFSENIKLKGSYLGQDPPGIKPIVFAPGLLSTEHTESISAISPDGKEIWYSVSLGHTRPTKMIVKEEDGRWIDPEEFSFSKDMRAGHMSLAPDGQRVYFSSGGRDADGNPTGNYDIWYTDKTESNWLKPRLLDPPVNTNANECQPFISASGKLYFTSDRPGSLGGLDVYCSEIVDGKFTEPKNMGELINSNRWEWDIFVSPDEKYLIVGSNRDSDDPDSFDLFISFRGNNGNWTEPKNMGPSINSSETELGVVLSPDGKYLFYHSGRFLPNSENIGYGNGFADIWWVSTEIVEGLKPKELR
jgi:tetratricopeptide (TPR) repeat protein